jgi:hypothetical protein
MGLDAAVYKRLEELPFTKEDLRKIAIDPTTGQMDFEDASLFRAWSSLAKAAEKRIGNIALVNLLKSEVEKVLGDSSAETILIRRILSSGTHSGDIISAGDLGLLKNEVALVRGIAGPKASRELEVFLTDLEELIAASETHGNPIVFI